MDEANREPHAASSTELMYVCDRCGERMEERKCKIICPNCGLCRDCSDP